MGQEGPGAALAIGARDEHHRIAFVRTAQGAQQRADVLETALDAEMTPLLEARNEDGLVVEVHQSLGVGIIHARQAAMKSLR